MDEIKSINEKLDKILESVAEIEAKVFFIEEKLDHFEAAGLGEVSEEETVNLNSIATIVHDAKAEIIEELRSTKDSINTATAHYTYMYGR